MFPIITIIYLLNYITKIKTDSQKNCKNFYKNFDCVECKSGYTLLNGDCPCYDPNCETCSSSLPGACSLCKYPFKLNTQTNSCSCNIDHCLFCSEQGCDQCEIGYILNNGICIDDTDYKCYDSHCHFCLNSKEGSCKKCFDGYNLESGKCFQNPTLLILIDKDILCPEGYFSIGNGCNKNCLDAECSDSVCINECLSCHNNVLTEKLNCKPDNYCVDPHCISCRNINIGFCDKCEIGYRLEFGSCVKCEDPNCLNCDYTLDGKCNSCKNQYYLINGTCYSKNQKDECDSSIENCEKCYIGDDKYCFECLEGYSLSNGKCIECNISNCLRCSKRNTCIQCSEGFILDSSKNQCIKNLGSIPNCLSYNSSQCTFCEKNYILNNSKCIYTNNSLTSCVSYECMSCYDESRRSHLCLDGSSYSSFMEKTCVPCSDNGCRICVSPKDCIICYLGLSMEKGKCEQKVSYNDSIIPNCILYDEAGNCIDCKKGCAISHGQCFCGNKLITILIILCGLILMIIIAFLLIYIKKRNEILMLQGREDAERKIIEKLQLKQTIIDKIIEEDNKLEKCKLCNKELAIYELNCGCKICKEDAKDYEIKLNNNNNEIKNENEDENYKNASNKYYNCPICKKIIEHGKQIAFCCDICFEVTSKLFKFSCGCSISVCKNCFNKIIETKKCPGCRKSFFENEKDEKEKV